MKTTCKLSKRDRDILTHTELLDQSRNLKITDFSSNLVYERLKYLIKLVNGKIIIVVNDTLNNYILRSILSKVRKRQQKHYSCVLSLDISQSSNQF